MQEVLPTELTHKLPLKENAVDTLLQAMAVTTDAWGERND